MENHYFEELGEYLLENRLPMERYFQRSSIKEQRELGDIALGYDVLEDVPFRVTRTNKDLTDEDIQDGWYNTLLLMDRSLARGQKVYVPEDFGGYIIRNTGICNQGSRLDLSELTAHKTANYIDHFTDDFEVEKVEKEGQISLSQKMQTLAESSPPKTTLITFNSSIPREYPSIRTNTPLGGLKASLGSNREIKSFGDSFHAEYEQELDYSFTVY